MRKYVINTTATTKTGKTLSFATVMLGDVNLSRELLSEGCVLLTDLTFYSFGERGMHFIRRCISRAPSYRGLLQIFLFPTLSLGYYFSVVRA